MKCYLCGADDPLRNLYKRAVCEDCFQRVNPTTCEWCGGYILKGDPEAVFYKDGEQKAIHRRCYDMRELMDRRRKK